MTWNLYANFVWTLNAEMQYSAVALAGNIINYIYFQISNDILSLIAII